MVFAWETVLSPYPYDICITENNPKCVLQSNSTRRNKSNIYTILFDLLIPMLLILKYFISNNRMYSTSRIPLLLHPLHHTGYHLADKSSCFPIIVSFLPIHVISVLIMV